MKTKHHPISLGKTVRNLVILLCVTTMSEAAWARDDISRDLKEVISDLAELRDQVTGFTKVSKDTGLGKQTTEAELAFTRASEAMSRGLWLTTIQETQRYLTLSQKPDPETWMKAQYMLGRAYEERSQSSRAVRAYLRYLSAFITAKKTKYSEMGDVLERLVKTATKSNERTKVELNQFLSSISAMELPEELMPELKYFTAVGGANIGQKNLALTWLGNIEENKQGVRPEQKARALNFRALLAMQESRWNDAESALQTIVTMDSLKSSAKEGARLSLARVYLRQKKPKTALEIYESFKEGSSVYREAIFEKTFVYIRQNRGEEARKSATEFLEKYPEHPDAMQVRSIQSWLEIHSGNLTAAKGSIESTEKELEKIRTQVEGNLTGKEKLTHENAKVIIALTRGLVTAPVELEDTLSMFEQLSELEERLEEVNGMVLNTLYAISKTDLDRYKPTFANRVDQLQTLLTRYQQISERHIGTESDRLTAALSDLDRQKLKGTASRRKALFGEFARLSRDAKRMVTWLGPAEQLAELARVWGKLQSVETHLPRATGDLAASSQETSGVSAVNLRKEMLKTLTDIRKEQVKNIVNQSKIKELKMILESYALSIHEDQSILASYEPHDSQTLDLLDDADSQSAWGQLSLVANLLDDAIESLEAEASKDVNSTLSQIEGLLTGKEKLTAGIKDLRDVLENKAGSAGAAILAHYDYVLGQRIARQQKWSGDVDYLTYTQKSKEQANLRKTHEVELQILSDNLMEVEQGGKAQWKR